MTDFSFLSDPNFIHFVENGGTVVVVVLLLTIFVLAIMRVIISLINSTSQKDRNDTITNSQWLKVLMNFSRGLQTSVDNNTRAMQQLTEQVKIMTDAQRGAETRLVSIESILKGLKEDIVALYREISELKKRPPV